MREQSHTGRRRAGPRSRRHHQLSQGRSAPGPEAARVRDERGRVKKLLPGDPSLASASVRCSPRNYPARLLRAGAAHPLHSGGGPRPAPRHRHPQVLHGSAPTTLVGAPQMALSVAIWFLWGWGGTQSRSLWATRVTSPGASEAHTPHPQGAPGGLADGLPPSLVRRLGSPSWGHGAGRVGVQSREPRQPLHPRQHGPQGAAHTASAVEATPPPLGEASGTSGCESAPGGAAPHPHRRTPHGCADAVSGAHTRRGACY